MILAQSLRLKVLKRQQVRKLKLLKMQKLRQKTLNHLTAMCLKATPRILRSQKNNLNLTHPK